MDELTTHHAHAHGRGMWLQVDAVPPEHECLLRRTGHLLHGGGLHDNLYKRPLHMVPTQERISALHTTVVELNFQ